MTTGNTATAVLGIAFAVLIGATVSVAPAMAGDLKSATNAQTPYVDIEAARDVIDAGPIEVMATPIDPISRGEVDGSAQPAPRDSAAVHTESDESASDSVMGIIASLKAPGDHMMIVGNSMTGFVNGGWWTEYYAPDGTIKGVWRSTRYFAKWSLDGKMMCFEKTARGSSCLSFTVEDDEAAFYREEDGVGGAKKFKLLQGNPKNL